MAASTVPLTWPPTPTTAPRWHHRVAYVIADIHDRIGRAHQHLTVLLDEVDHAHLDLPPVAGHLQ
jgi:hypothetical protein